VNKADRIEREFTNRAILRGGLLLLQPSDAIDMVQRCRQESLAILGIDAFKITATATQPVIEDSIDFSGETRAVHSLNVWQEAEQFLRNRQNKGLVFEIVLDSI
jgi:hypothetical protein